MQPITSGMFIMRFKSGKIATFEMMMVDTVLGPEPFWRVTGTRGQIAVGRQQGVWLFDPARPEGVQILEAPAPSTSFGPELADFAAAVLDGHPLDAGPEYSLGELRTALAMYRSVKSRKWEKVW